MCPSARRAVCRLVLAAAAVLASALPARAEVVRVQFPTRTAAGEVPKLVLTAEVDLEGLEVSLRDEAGRPLGAHAGPLRAGSQHQVNLPAGPGRHRYTGQITVKHGGSVERRPISFETVMAGKLEIAIDRAKVDLPGRRLEARLSRPPAKAEISVFSAAGGEPIAQAEHDLRGQAAGAPLTITWPAPTAGADEAGEPARIDLRLTDVEGFFASVALFPWRLFIPHEEVIFATDSATIAAAERPKLEASLGKISDALARSQGLPAVKLYIAGHTDRVGTPAHNLQLSRARAAAIASWFRKRGLRITIMWEGFGEEAPLVPTPDDTPEARNRRVDYILGIEDPIIAVRSQAGAPPFRPTWRR